MQPESASILQIPVVGSSYNITEAEAVSNNLDQSIKSVKMFELENVNQYLDQDMRILDGLDSKLKQKQIL